MRSWREDFFLGYAVETLTDNCVTGIGANEKRCRELVENSIGIITEVTGS